MFISNEVQPFYDRVELVEHEASKPGKRLYTVKLDGNVIGHVKHGQETIERRIKGSRIVSSRWTRTRWVFQTNALGYNRRYFDSRQRAVVELLEQLVRNGSLAS